MCSERTSVTRSAEWYWYHVTKKLLYQYNHDYYYYHHDGILYTVEDPPDPRGVSSSVSRACERRSGRNHALHVHGSARGRQVFACVDCVPPPPCPAPLSKRQILFFFFFSQGNGLFFENILLWLCWFLLNVLLLGTLCSYCWIPYLLLGFF